MKIPTSYNEISVEQYMKAYEIMNDDFEDEIDRTTSLVAYFTGESFNFAECMNGNEYKAIAEKLSFLKFDLPLFPISEFVSIGKQMFTSTKSLTQMKVNQMIDFQSIYKANGNNISKCLDKLLPIVYVQKEYDPNKHEQNVELFKQVKVSEVSGLVFFYSDYWLNVEKTIQIYIEKQSKLIQERMDWIVANPQYLHS